MDFPEDSGVEDQPFQISTSPITPSQLEFSPKNQCQSIPEKRTLGREKTTFPPRHKSGEIRYPTPPDNPTVWRVWKMLRFSVLKVSIVTVLFAVFSQPS
ncbi:MAG: hypothetical protein KC940_24300, partial [Candidatus Omnitrophica bacterium]|nr:hypothetical protein [Candidatus Omnitrophota bacterium]